MCENGIFAHGFLVTFGRVEGEKKKKKQMRTKHF